MGKERDSELVCALYEVAGQIEELARIVSELAPQRIKQVKKKAMAKAVPAWVRANPVAAMWRDGMPYRQREPKKRKKK
jgi:hypothetical protein